MTARVLKSKSGLAWLLAALFFVNFAETQLEELMKGSGGFNRGYQIAEAFAALEGSLRFDQQAPPEMWSVGIFSFSYFILFPLLLIGTAVALWRDRRAGPFRVYTLSFTFNYLLSLPFFLFFPVPERWAFPASNATLLSDLLSTHLIEIIRPISGLDNCFPSIHVSFSILTAVMAYRFRLELRHSLLCLALTVVLATFVLGIHWIPDLLMGGVMAVLAFACAVLVDRRLDGPLPKDRRRSVGWQVEEEPAPALAAPAHGRGKLAFISYRRERGSQLARVVHTELERRGLPCFLDVDDLGAEHFDERLLREIEKTPNFIVILSPGALDRCQVPDDWLRREIATAIQNKRNIVPLMVEGFQFPQPGQLPEDLRDLVRHNGVTYSHEYFSATFDKLQNFLTAR